MEKAADLFKTSFTRPNTLKLLVTFTSGKDESGSDRVKFKSAMNSLTDQGIKRLVFAASKTNVVKELSFNKYQNLFLLSAYRLTNVAYRLWSYLPRKGWLYRTSWLPIFLKAKLALSSVFDVAEAQPGAPITSKMESFSTTVNSFYSCKNFFLRCFQGSWLRVFVAYLPPLV